MIPVENVFYLLCYAWNRSEMREQVQVGQTAFKDQLSMLAKVFCHACEVLLKRGLAKAYEPRSEVLQALRGKPDMIGSFSRQTQLQMRLICDYDELEADILPNRLLKAVLRRLLHAPGLPSSLQLDVARLLRVFRPISEIPLQAALFENIRLHRNNAYYGLALDIGKLISQSLLPTETPGVSRFHDFLTDDQRMPIIFEAFIRNFYRSEQTRFPRVTDRWINWDVENTSLDDLAYLPRMHTDITLEAPDSILIIDTKYYKQMMVERFDRKRFRSEHLYQMHAYLSNLATQDARPLSGMLLYPAVDLEIDVTYRLQGRSLRLKTLNLKRAWQEIHQELLHILPI